MSNTLTGLIPTLYNGLDTVSRELVGFIPSVRRDSKLERAALNETITSPVTPSATSTNVSPSMTIPEGTAQTIGKRDITISKSKAVLIPWEGEEMKSLTNGDEPQISRILSDQFAQAVRTLVNEMETDIGLEFDEASNAYGTAGTTPFASNLSDLAQVKRLLDDNGAPSSDRSFVMNTLAGANLRTTANLSYVNNSGSDQTLRQGELLNVYGFSLKESNGIANHTAGTGASATTNSAGYAIGDTVITLASAGTGTILKGDVIVFTGDANQYVVESGDTDVSDGGTITISAPGLKEAIAASPVAITLDASYAANLGFPRSAIDFIMRLPEKPEGQDAAVDSVQIQDPKSGLVFEISKYLGYKKVLYEVAASWGQRISKPEHVVILQG